MDAVILAGGENKRIPVIKGFLEINGKSIVESNIELLKGIFSKVIVSTNNPELYFPFGVLMVGDVVEYRGPMTGIFSVLIGADTTEIFVAACDMPFINGILVKAMVDRWENKRDALIPVFKDRPEPVLGIYSKRVVPKMEDSLRTGRRSLMDFLKEIDVLFMGEEEVKSFDREGRSFVNINTMEDFHREGGKTCSEHRI